MKKFIALVIAVLMLAALAVPAFAEDATDVDYSEGTTIIYSPNDTDTYALTVPSEIELGKAAGTITVTDYQLSETQKLNVTAVSDYKFGDIANAFAIKVNDGDNLTASFEAQGATATIKAVAASGTPTEPGDYQGSITYTVEIVNK